MNSLGMVALVITVHELAVLLSLLTMGLVVVAGAVILRRMAALPRVLTILAFGLGTALMTLAVSSRTLDVRPLDLELVRVGH